MTRLNPEIKELVDETFFNNPNITYDEHEKFLMRFAANFGWSRAIFRVKSMLHELNVQLERMLDEQEYPDADEKGGEK